jgi:hypothetical protein
VTLTGVTCVTSWMTTTNQVHQRNQSPSWRRRTMNLGDDDLRLLCVIEGETEVFPRAIVAQS